MSLDYLVAIFGLLFLSGIAVLLQTFFHDRIWIFYNYEGISSPVAYSIVRNLGTLSMIFIYILAEHILNERANIIRASILTSSISVYMLNMFYYQNTKKLILVSDVLPFARDTRLDELAYDLIWLLSLYLILYAYIQQYKISVNSIYRQKIKLIIIAISIFDILYIYEFLEHFLNIRDIDFIIFSAPTMIIFGVIYLKTPNFSYYVPSNVSFLQISTIDGHLIYSADLRKSDISKDYLTNVSLSSINTLLSEVIDADSSKNKLKSINFDHGTIIFETVGEFIAILFVDKSSKILRRSMKYLIHEFVKKYEDQIQSKLNGVLLNDFKNVEELISRCIPMIESKLLYKPIIT